MSTILDPHRREAARLTELQRLEAMSPEADRVLQDLVDDAREVFGARCCLVNLVTSDTHYFRAWSGDLPSELVEVRRNPAGPSMCRHVVEDERPFVVEDFATTEQVEARRLRMGSGVRFYAGTPLKTSGGHVIGSFCVLDDRPRQFGDRDSATLRAFAKAAVGRLEALGAAAQEREAKEAERRYRRNVFELANDAIVIHGAETGLILDANRRACEVYDLPQEDLVGKKLAELSLEPEAEEEHSREVLHRGAHRGFETVHRRAGGIPMDVSVNSSVTEYGGQRAILSIVRDVTGRKRTEEALRRSEKSLAQAQRIAHIGNWEHELGEHRTHWSDEMYRIFGFAPLALVPSYRTFIFFVHPDDKERVRRSIRGALYGNGAGDIEYRIVRPDGEVRFVHTQYEVAYDEGGRPTRFVGTVQDVTDRKRAEAALRESEIRHRRQAKELELLHQVRTALAQELEPPAVFRTVVEAIAKTYGYTQVSAYRLQGQTLVLQHQVGYEQVLARIPIDRGIMGRVARTRRPMLLGDVRSDPEFLGAIEGITSELCVLLLDGDEVAGTLNVESTRGVELTEDDLRLIGALAEHVNVALSWARLHARVRDSEERFRSLIQNASDIITLLEADGTIRYQSHSIARILGYQPEELVGKNAFEHIHPEDVERVFCAFDEGVKNPGSRPFVEYRFKHKDGSWRHLESIGSNLLDDPGVGKFVVNSRDITERKRVEEEIREANRRLSELATLKADFTAMVAHELDTPLAVIRGYADVMATGELGSAERERALSQIQSETEVLNALVGDVRVAASAERNDFTVSPRSVPVGGLLEDAARFVATLSDDHPLVVEGADDAGPWEGVRAGYADPFVFEGGADGPKVWADRYRIGQVLRNLLTNAVKYSPEGTPIELGAVPDEAAGRVRIEVVDHGPGIHTDDLERIFEKFGRGRDQEGRKVAGLGLGLYLSRRILRAHGSDLVVEAAPGGGSVFSFDLASDR